MELRITENITDTAAGAAGAAVSRGTLGTFTNFYTMSLVKLLHLPENGINFEGKNFSDIYTGCGGAASRSINAKCGSLKSIHFPQQK